MQSFYHSWLKIGEFSQHHYHIGLLFVDKNYQRRGIGKQLILHILKQKDDKPTTVNASPYGHEFYKKLGFKDTDVEQVTNGVRYYPMINNYYCPLNIDYIAHVCAHRKFGLSLA